MQLTFQNLEKDVANWMANYGTPEQCAIIERDIILLEKNERRKIDGKPDKRKMSEDLFWELVDKSRTPDGDVSSQCLKLIGLLESFSGPTIKSFQKLLTQKIFLANRWDIWALAYLAQDGCSDDSFEMFRSWLLLQGKTAFDSALANVDTVFHLVPAGLSTQCGQLSSCAHIACENRTGLPLLNKERLAKISPAPGREWHEGNVEQLYPEIAKYYKT